MATVMTPPAASSGNMMRNRFTPDAFRAVISKSDVKRPNAIRVATKTAIGTESAIIQARLSPIISKTTATGRSLSIT